MAMELHHGAAKMARAKRSRLAPDARRRRRNDWISHARHEIAIVDTAIQILGLVELATARHASATDYELFAVLRDCEIRCADAGERPERRGIRRELMYGQREKSGIECRLSSLYETTLRLHLRWRRKWIPVARSPRRVRHRKIEFCSGDANDGTVTAGVS